MTETKTETTPEEDVGAGEVTETSPASDLERFREALAHAREQRPRLVPAVLWGVPVIVLSALLMLASVNPIEVVVFGTQFGAITALVALGIALVFKATRVLNFAQGAFGTVAAFIAYSIMVGFELGDIALVPDADQLWWASIVAVVGGAVLGILVNVLVVQRLAEASQVISLVATVGVALAFTATEIIVFQAQARPFPRYVEGNACFGPSTEQAGQFALCPFTIGGVTVPWHTVVVIAILALAAALLALFFRTRPGIALLATAQEPFAAELQGISVRAMATLAWGMAGALGALAGLLGAGVFTQLTPGLMTSTFLIAAFTGAILGGITSMVGAVIGALLVGIIRTMANSLVLATGVDIPGPPDAAILLVLLLVLFFRPSGLFGEEI